MKDKEFLDWVVLAVLGLLFALNTIYFVQAIGEAQVVCLGWFVVMVGIAIYFRLISRQPTITSKKVLDLFTALCGIGAVTLLQSGIMVFLLFKDKTPLVWMASLMLLLTMIGLTLYKYR